MKLRELVLGGEVDVGERKVADAGKKGFVRGSEARRSYASVIGGLMIMQADLNDSVRIFSNVNRTVNDCKT